MLGDELTERKPQGTHSTLCLSPHLPQPHPNGRRMPHRASRGVHDLLSCFRIDHPHPDNPPKESLMRIVRFLSPQSLQFFVVEKGLHPKIVVHSKSLKLLGQGKVCEDHIMDLNYNKSVFNQLRPDLLRHTCCPDG